MYSTINLSILVSAMACILTTVGAAPTLQLRDIFSPPILVPNAATVWFAGQHQNILTMIPRDASNPPKSISNGASIMLKTAVPSDWIPLTLAKGFSLLDGRHEIVVPTNVTSRDDWEIVYKSRIYVCLMINESSLSMIVFGDSGNVSPAFTILTY
ncbi:hypothetical protein JB92DRAFT_2981085 [Gautieria morchelliformis]|nr:hypothetical protein JB92DRAFT_2981085 [Gautieria morchelliformis]